MTHPRNILFIMADQLRWDCLSCYGNSLVSTPNIDRLAKEGVTFDRAYCQSHICGPSRMSFYTGRYSQSHGATWNGIPLKVGEITLGDFLREQGLSTWLVGKTHFYPDVRRHTTTRHWAGIFNWPVTPTMRFPDIWSDGRPLSWRTERKIQSSQINLRKIFEWDRLSW